jgi:tol-pal system protein YbgF
LAELVKQRTAPSRQLSRLALASVVLAASGCVSSTDIDALSSQISDLQRQVLQVQTQGSSKEEIAKLQAALQQQTQALLRSEADMQVDLESLSNQIQALQARLEETNMRLERLSQQAAATAQEMRTSRDVPGAAPPAIAADPQAMYQAAYGDYLKHSYDLAVMGFQQYLQAFPDTELSDNAAYWVGECYFGQGKFEQAIQQFDLLQERFPRSDKTASAWLKKGYALLELGQRQAGVAQLRKVIKDYPGSDEANLARQRLRALGVDAG